jgi:hypothetical protein
VLSAGEGSVPLLARRGGKVFPQACYGCAAAFMCDGLDPRYLAERGHSELVPYAAARGDLIHAERLAYLPAFICKTGQRADARGAVRAAFEWWGSSRGWQAPPATAIAGGVDHVAVAE